MKSTAGSINISIQGGGDQVSTANTSGDRTEISGDGASTRGIVVNGMRYEPGRDGSLKIVNGMVVQ